MAQVDSENSTAMPAGLRVPQDMLIARLARQARKRERALARLRELRTRASDEIDRLLEFLDASDLDPDLEETADDEPSLGWTIAVPQGAHCGGIDDLEQEDGNDEPDADGEPSLGSVGDMHFNQERWASGGRRDLEDEHDGSEPGEDDEPALGWHNTEPQHDACGSGPQNEEEPSLGSTSTINQEAWAFGRGNDLEQG